MKALEFQARRVITTEWDELRQAFIDALINSFIDIEFDGKIKMSGVFGDPVTVAEEERYRETQLQNQGLEISRFGWADVESDRYIEVLQNLLNCFNQLKSA